MCMRLDGRWDEGRGGVGGNFDQLATENMSAVGTANQRGQTINIISYGQRK